MAALSPRIAGALEEWEGLTEGARVLAYDPLPDEPALGAVVSRANVFLTRTSGERLTIHPFDSPRERHPFGFTQPVAGSEALDPAEIDVVLVPGLAFDVLGTRLGRGGGHYDRLLGMVGADALLVGVTPSALVVLMLPREEHDVGMTHLATEEGVVPVSVR